MPATRSADAAAAAVAAPLVFSCRSCHRVVGDSFNFVWSSEEMNCITLNAVNKKVVEVVKEDFITSKQKGPDAGSTYYVMTCRGCSNMIGRSYQTTAKALDHIRGCFTLDREALESYELGSGKVHEDGSGSGGSAGTAGSTTHSELEGEVGRVREDLVKIQEMLLLFSERLAQLEQGPAATTDDSSLQHDLDETQLLKGSRGHAKRRRKEKK